MPRMSVTDDPNEPDKFDSLLKILDNFRPSKAIPSIREHFRHIYVVRPAAELDRNILPLFLSLVPNRFIKSPIKYIPGYLLKFLPLILFYCKSINWINFTYLSFPSKLMKQLRWRYEFSTDYTNKYIYICTNIHLYIFCRHTWIHTHVIYTHIHIDIHTHTFLQILKFFWLGKFSGMQHNLVLTI